jgi:hypothetical protein
METPSKLNPVNASVKELQEAEKLAKMTLKSPALIPAERLFADVIIEKTGLEKFSIKKIAHAGLNLLARVSGDKFQYKTNGKNEIKEVEFESRLLAFSIQTSKPAIQKEDSGK